MLDPTFRYNLHGCVIQASDDHAVIEIWKDEKLIETLNGDITNLSDAVSIARYGAGKRHEAKREKPIEETPPADDPAGTPIPTVGQIADDEQN